jgi:hypothetical protein
MEQDFITIEYTKQDNGSYACVLTSSISLVRSREHYQDMKVYTRRSRVYDRFVVEPGDEIHIDVYANNGEGPLDQVDFQVADQSIVVTSPSPDIQVKVREVGEESE